LFEILVYEKSVVRTVERNENGFFFEDIENLRLERFERIGIELSGFQPLKKDIKFDIFELGKIKSFFRKYLRIF